MRFLRIIFPIAAACLGMTPEALRLEPIKYGDFSNWVSREVAESKLLGGKKKTIYEIAPTRTMPGNNTPYSNEGGSPWATSNVYAKVAGVVKASGTVTPAMVNGNKVARMEARMEEVKVMGIINMDVMVAGTIFLGRIFEPITSPKGPIRKWRWEYPIPNGQGTRVRLQGGNARYRHKNKIHGIFRQENTSGTRQRRSLCAAAETLGRQRRKHIRTACRHRKGTLFQKHRMDKTTYVAYTLRRHIETKLV